MKINRILSAVSAAVFLFSSALYYPHISSAEETTDTFSASCIQTALSPAFSEEQAEKLPEKYDLREKGLVSSVKNQGSFGTCWSFAASAALETSMIKKEPFIDLSELHLAYFSFFGDDTPSNPEKDPDSFISGGHMAYAAASFARWTGPVSESLLPYNTEKDDIDTSVGNRSDYFVSDVNIINQYSLKDTSPDDIIRFSDNEIKQMLMDDSAVAVNIRYENTCSEETFAQYDNTRGKTNHAVLIVGWDDSYSRDNFLVKPPGDGAWIAKNSWGDDWGDNGFFYISYYDRSLSDACTLNAEKAGRYQHNYQHDKLFYTAAVSPDNSLRNTGFMANIFTAEADEYISGSGFYTTDNNASYEITVYTDLKDLSDPTSGQAGTVTSGTEKYAGYHTVSLDEPVFVKKGEKFSVTAKLTNPEYFCSIPVEAAVILMENRFATNVSDISEEEIEEQTGYGESFISSNGTKWNDTKDMQIECVYDNPKMPDSNIMYYIGNVCLKAFGTNDLNYKAEPDDSRSVLSSLTVNGSPVAVSDKDGNAVTVIKADNNDTRDHAVLFPSGTGNITVNGKETLSGHETEKIPLDYGENHIKIISSEPGKTETEYDITVFRKRASVNYYDEVLIFDEENADITADDGHSFINGESISDYLGQTLSVKEKNGNKYPLEVAPRRELSQILEPSCLSADNESIRKVFSFKDKMYFSTSPDMSDPQDIRQRMSSLLFETVFKIYPDYDSDLYFQIAATENSPKSTVSHFSIPSRPVISDDDVSIEILDDTSFSITVNDTASKKPEYRTEIKYSTSPPDSSVMYPAKTMKEDTEIITDLIPGKTYSLYMRFRYSSDQFKSYIKDFTVEMPGEREICSFNYEKEKIIFDEKKYRVTAADGTEMKCYDSVSELTGSDIVMTDNNGNSTTVTIPARAAAPETEIDFREGRLTGTFDNSISFTRTVNGQTDQESAVPSTNLSGKDGIITLKKLFSSYYSEGDVLNFFYAHTENSFASEICSITVPHQDTISKNMIDITGYTDRTISLREYDGLEYGIRRSFKEEFEWQDSGIFTGLSPEVQYILSVRYKATDETPYSMSAFSIITTLPSEYKAGDLNDDKMLSAADILIFRRMLLDSLKPDAQQKRGADINEDGKINVFDFQRLLFRINGEYPE